MAKRSWQRAKMAQDSAKKSNATKRIQGWVRKSMVIENKSVVLESVGEGLWADRSRTRFARACEVNGLLCWVLENGKVRETRNWIA